MKGDDRTFVYWIERRGRGSFLQATPIDVSSLLDEKLFERIDTVVLTSATLAVGETFDFTERRLGIRAHADAGGPQPFRLREAGAALRAAAPARSAHSRVYLARPPTKSRASCGTARGRAFVLFTSYQQMRLVYDRVSLEIDYPHA